MPLYPNQEIQRLRKEGKIDKALRYGIDALQQDPDNPWIKGALAWVYYDMAKRDLENTSVFIEHVEEILKLGLDETEKLLYGRLGFLIGKKVFQIIRQKDFPKQPVNKLFELSKQMHFNKPGEAYSFLFKAFHKAYKDSSKYIELADWWGFENFRQQDYEPEKINDRKVMSIVEQAYIAYTKALLKGEPVYSTGIVINPFDRSDPGVTIKVNEEKVKNFLPQLNKIINKHPEYKFLQSGKAKLLLAIGKKDDALNSFLPFARRKHNEFWVWKYLVDFFPDDIDLQIAFYCKALSFNTQEKYLVKLRQKFAAILIKKGFFAEAKFQIEKLVQTRNKEKWKIPAIVESWQSQDWYKTTNARPENKFCKKYLPEAEKILYSDIPEEIVVVTFVNKDKGLIHFVKNTSKHGFFRYSGNIDAFQPGDIVKVRFKGNAQDSYYRIYTLKKADNSTPTDAIKNIEGTLKLVYGKNFGFIDDVFVPPYLVAEYQLNEGEFIKGRAILSFDKSKKRWGWKMVEIIDN